MEMTGMKRRVTTEAQRPAALGKVGDIGEPVVDGRYVGGKPDFPNARRVDESTVPLNFYIFVN